MSLETQLAKIREMAAKNIPPDKLSVMQAATAAQRESGIMDGVVKVGDRILFGKYGGQEIKVEDEEYLIMSEQEVLCVIG